MTAANLFERDPPNNPLASKSSPSERIYAPVKFLINRLPRLLPCKPDWGEEERTGRIGNEVNFRVFGEFVFPGVHDELDYCLKLARCHNHRMGG